MVAEAVAEKELPTSPAAEPTPPEPAPESAPVEDDVPEEAVSAFLKAEKLIGDSGDASGDDTPTGDDGPDLSKLSPQEILEHGKRLGKSELQTESQTQAQRYQQQQRVEGARTKLAQSRATLQALLTQAGNDTQTVMTAIQAQDDLHGAWNQVYQADMAALQTETAKTFTDYTHQIAAQKLGQTKGKALLSDWAALPETDRSTEKFLDLFLQRSGYLSPSDVDKKVSGAVQAFIKKLPAEARNAIGFNPSSTRADGANGAGVSRSDDARLLDPATPVPVLKEIMARRRR